MQTNLGPIDGYFRVLLFIAAICYAVMAGGHAWWWTLPTGILFLTAAVKWCPIYASLGLHSGKE